MGGYKRNFIWLFLNLNENIRNKWKIAENQGVMHKKLLISHLIIAL